MSLRRSVLYSLCVPSAFGRRAGFDVNTSHDFPQVCWQRSPWEQVGLEMEGLRARAMCEPGLLLCSLAITALFGLGMGSKLLK